MAEVENALNWIFTAECEVPKEAQEVMVPGEEAFAAYKTVRDVAIFTNKRLIVRDAQGLTGKKVEVYSLPWSNVNMWSSENSGHFDLTAEIELWTRAGHIKVSLRGGIDVRKLDKLISESVLNS